MGHFRALRHVVATPVFVTPAKAGVQRLCALESKDAGFQLALE
jgi:hypothetical protein